jgi:hypothetical protein
MININSQQIRITGDKTGLAKVAVQYSTDTFVFNQILVFQVKFCGKIPTVPFATLTKDISYIDRLL